MLEIIGLIIVEKNLDQSPVSQNNTSAFQNSNIVGELRYQFDKYLF